MATFYASYDGNPVSSGGGGTVTSVTAGTGLTGGTITTSGTIALAIPVTVPDGGTGDTTLTAHAVLLGEGVSAVGFAATGTSGQLLIDQGAGADPAFEPVSGDITITNNGVTALKNTGTAGTYGQVTTDAQGRVTSGTTNDVAHGGTGQVTAGAAFNALSPLTTKGDIISYSTTNTRLPVGSDGQVLTADSAQTLGVKWNTPATGGTVTSVAMTVPTFLSVAGSPITTSGTLAVTLSGTALPILNGGTGQTTASAAFNALSPMTAVGDLIVGGTAGAGTRLAVGTANQILSVNTGGTTEEWRTLVAGTSGTDFAVAFASGTTTLNLPDASATARGVVTTGTQTIAGVKTFTGSSTTLNELNVASTTDSSSTGTVNNLSVTTGLYKFTASTTITLTGVVAPSADGMQFTLYNGTGNTLIIEPENGGSTAANRIDTGTGTNIFLGANGIAYFVYAGARWCVILGPQVALTSGSFAPTGAVGEVMQAAVGSTAISTGGTNVTSVPLTKGNWLLTGQVGYNNAAAQWVQYSVNTASGTVTGTFGLNFAAFYANANAGNSLGGGAVTFTTALSGSQTYFLNAASETGTPSVSGSITAVRLA